MTTYHKTARGQKEIAERSGELGLRARRLLILVDGQRTVSELAGWAGDHTFDESLHALVSGGFIAPLTATVQSGAPLAASGDAAPEPSRAPGGATREASLALAQDFMMNTLRTFHGPYGKLDLVKRIHASRQATELRALFDEWLQSISESRIGRKRADELSARLLEVMPG